MNFVDSATLTFCLALFHLLSGPLLFLLPAPREQQQARNYWLGYSLTAAALYASTLFSPAWPAYSQALLINLLLLIKCTLLLLAFSSLLELPGPLLLQRQHLLPLIAVTLLAALLLPAGPALSLALPLLLGLAFNTQLAWLLLRQHPRPAIQTLSGGYLAAFCGFEVLYLLDAMRGNLPQFPLEPALSLPLLLATLLLTLCFALLGQERELSSLRRQASEDPLTGLLNRRSFEEQARRMCALHARQQQTLTLLIIDLDHFKRINDCYGHSLGDSALRSMATIVTQHTRAGDLFARIGGEEFCLLLPHTDTAGAREVAAKLAAHIRSVRVLPEQADSHLTASIGIASLQPAGAHSWPQLFEQADKRLYRAKHAGRDQLVWCDA
ncbi:GGDEF domain-containing protein [Vogesella oryzae]|uniref:GGDEF domain-containing protein n=1 Tax=Vogesella oryzae TaxID=1735285 RepID=UPI0015827B11|nr:GGDEF domain-containing protein [Vogesella oryzae]